MMRTVDGLIDILVDGQFHSGESLGALLGISRAAVWKAVKSLDQYGLRVHAVRGRGYRLASAVELLDEEAICSLLSPQVRQQLGDLEVLRVVDSTNQQLLRAGKMHRKSGSICLAEWQQAGKGRRGRTWQSPFGGSINLSLAWQFPGGPARLSGLSLAIGVAVIRTLRTDGLTLAGLKWPNDIVLDGHKLGGILIEMVAETEGPSYVVIGVGINIDMVHAANIAIDQPWTDIVTALDGAVIPRNRLAAGIIDNLLRAVSTFEKHGFAGFQEEWMQYDALAGKDIVVHTASERLQGRSRGVDAEGALLMEYDGRILRYDSGEVSLRGA
jgi:BirA family biotin operon repressor/biotin-[acetyl-CoA-carboxylase] ligase